MIHLQTSYGSPVECGKETRERNRDEWGHLLTDDDKEPTTNAYICVTCKECKDRRPDIFG
jgi:hypothetical protein